MKKYIVANHKNYMLKQETVDFIENISNSDFNSKCNLIICPSYIYFPYYENKGFSLGMQDFDILKPLSGGISVEQMKSLDVKYCIVGHSDNRINKNENDKDIKNKLEVLLANDIIPILCFGENTPTSFEDVIKKLCGQLFEVLDYLVPEKLNNIILAYEPVWSINNGKDKVSPPNPDVLKKIIFEIKNKVKNRYKIDIRILYGGSVNKDNIESLNSINVIDGYLIGKCSTNSNDFSELISKL